MFPTILSAGSRPRLLYFDDGSPLRILYCVVINVLACSRQVTSSNPRRIDMLLAVLQMLLCQSRCYNSCTLYVAQKYQICMDRFCLYICLGHPMNKVHGFSQA